MTNTFIDQRDQTINQTSTIAATKHMETYLKLTIFYKFLKKIKKVILIKSL